MNLGSVNAKTIKIALALARLPFRFKFGNTALPLIRHICQFGPPNSYSDKVRDELQLSVGNIASNQKSMLKTVQLGTGPLRWNLFFSARTGYFTELLRVQRVGNEWKTALKVIRTRSTSKNEVLLEKIDSDYPLSKDGQVEW